MAQTQDLAELARLTWPKWMTEAYEEAVVRWKSGELGCTAVYQRGREAGKRCLSKPGKGTTHEGWGNCVAHRGAWKSGRAIGAWLMAHAFAEEYDLSPWESLLYVIRITAGRVRYCELVLAGARDDRQLEGREVETGETVKGGENDGAPVMERGLGWWVETSERERVLLAKVSKAAIDAGVAQLLVERELAAGNQLADMLVGVWEELRAAGLDKKSLDLARDVMKRKLAELDGAQRAIEGAVT